MKKKIIISEATDLVLVGLLQQNKKNKEAFEELIKRYESKVHNLSMRLTRNAEDTEEVMQDVFVTLYNKAHLFRGQSAFSSWLYRIVANAAFMKLRKRKQSVAISLEELAPHIRQQCLEQTNPMKDRQDYLAITRELSKTLEDAISRLPKQYRSVFMLRDVDGLSNEETGQLLKLTIPAVKSRLHRSRTMLQRRLKSYYQEFTGNYKSAA